MNGDIHDIAHEGSTVVVALAGEIDRVCIPAIATQLFECAPPERDLVIDLSRVEFMDGGGISMIAAAAAERAATGCSVRLRSPRRIVRRLLEVCEMTDLADP